MIIALGKLFSINGIDNNGKRYKDSHTFRFLVSLLVATVLKMGSFVRNNVLYPPPYEKLVGNLAGYYSRRINIQHRLVYQVLQDINTVKVVTMWSHYELNSVKDSKIPSIS